jgi:predicted O-methyltransferase YrrM
MASSYRNSIDYLELFRAIAFVTKPKRIVEFGILNGASLEAMVSGAPEAKITAYDIFDRFNGNHADRGEIYIKFREFPNVAIDHGDFYEKASDFVDGSIDLLHIDIANDASVYRFALENYWPKLSDDGVMVLEGGSQERDQVPWMTKYDKMPIHPYLRTLDGLSWLTIGEFPSLTVMKKGGLAPSLNR